LTIEAPVKFLRIPLFLSAFLTIALIPAYAQTPVTPPSAVDPAILASAGTGSAAAQIKAGDAYAAGTGSERSSRQLAADYKEAANWYRKAANQGSIAAEIKLADLYRDGRGVTRDMAQAVVWYKKAADQGDASAQGTLGLLYSVGMGVAQDYVEAYYWLDLASSASGPNQAKYMANRQSVGEHITTDQQQTVEDRVAAWKAAHPHVGSAQ